MLLYIAAWFPIAAVAIGNGFLRDIVFKGRVWPAMLVWVAIAPFPFYRLHT